jgi:hypothetical protein
MTKWTQFWDMHSGGGSKEKWEHIYINAPEKEAKIIFYNRFGHNPDRITCTCCGNDYSISEGESLAQMTAFHRGCDYVAGEYVEVPDTKYDENKKLITLEDYLKSKDVHVIYDKDISPQERIGEVPEQGYVWVG